MAYGAMVIRMNNCHHLPRTPVPHLPFSFGLLLKRDFNYQREEILRQSAAKAQEKSSSLEESRRSSVEYLG